MVLFWTSLAIALIIAPLGVVAWKWVQYRFFGYDPTLSRVTRQHLDLYQGGELDEEAVEDTKRRYERWFKRGQVERVKESLRPDLEYVIKVRALAEIGTEEACEILEKEISRKHTSDRMEQACYWIDLAHNLRMISREESLPALLNRVEIADNFPLMHFYAAQMVWFNQFSGYLRTFPDRQGITAIRVLFRAIEGMRNCVDPRLVAEAQLGQLVETVWDNRGQVPHPIIIRLLLEVRRHLRRVDYHLGTLKEDAFEREAYQMQISRMAALDGSFEKYLTKVREDMPELLAVAHPDDINDWLHCVIELRAEGGSTLLHWGKRLPVQVDPQLTLEAMAYSHEIAITHFLKEGVARALSDYRHDRRWLPLRPTMEMETTAAAIYALRHHPSHETEMVLLSASKCKHAEIKAAAIASLGWWEPLQRNHVQMALKEARYSRHGEVRRSARAALARLGERSSLEWYRQALASENQQVVMEVIHTIADEGLTLLWPELDQYANDDDPMLAQFAAEALEQMQEDHDLRFHRKL